MWVLLLIQDMEPPPELLHISPGRVGQPRRCVTVPAFQYGVRSARVHLYHCWLQSRPDFCCSLLFFSTRVHQQGAPDGLGEPPRHIKVVARDAVEVCLCINQPDEFGGHQEGARGVLQGGGGGVGSKFLMAWNFISTMPSSAAGDILCGNYLLPRR